MNLSFLGHNFPLGRGARQVCVIGSNFPVNSITLVRKLDDPSGIANSCNSSHDEAQNLLPSAFTLKKDK